ncbi:MAG TPA: hypothetical protein VFX03_11170, partial [Thermomicrobiales bacterium]|nr:hypothetical protein [Thermomicrobiales bacterium]
MGISGAFLEMIERPMLATVNGYAYMRASYNLRWSHVPGLLRYTASAIAMVFGSAIPLWRDQALPAYLATIARWRNIDLATATDQELLAGVRALAWADAAYWWSTALVVGAAKISDAVLDRVLALALPGRGLSSAMFLRGFPSTLRDAETALETIAAQIRADEAAQTLVAATPAQDLLAALADAPAGQAPLRALRDYLARYGHQIYTLDFAEPTLGEETLPIALSLKALVEHPGRTALERQVALAEERDQLTAETERSLDPLRRFLFRRVVRWAQRFAPYREEALFYVGAAWPTLRRLALELGRRLAEAGSLATADDIFFLRTAEIEAAITARADGAGRRDLARLAQERRALREARQRLHPPAAVPPDYRYTFGPFDISGFETQRRNAPEGATLRGFAV